MDIFQKNVAFHKANLKKIRTEGEIVDFGLLAAEHPRHWGFIMDEGYQGASEMVTDIISKKKLQNVTSTVAKESCNRKTAHDRIIVIFFGRTGTL